MELHQLRYFLAVAQTGSFTVAARSCFVSQPSLSAQIAKLEDELGGLLIERHRQGAKLTKRGELFRGRAAEALRQLESGRFEIQQLDGLARGTVTLGCLPTTGAYLLPPLLKTFAKAYPKIEVILREESSPQLAHMLSESAIDLAILDEAGLGEGLRSEVIFSEQLLIVIPAAHRLAGSHRIALQALNDEPLILRKPGHGFRKIVLDALMRAGVTPRIVYETGEIDTVQALVKAGLGLSIVPQIVKRADLKYLEILPPTPSRTVHIAWLNDSALSPAALAMKTLASSIQLPGSKE